MTFHPDQIVSNEEWDRRHYGHEIKRRVEKFPFESSSNVRRMHYQTCKDCDETHLYKMDDVFECPHCNKEMKEDAPYCKKCAKRPTCDQCKKRKNRVISVPGIPKRGVCGPCYRRHHQ